MHPVSSLSPRPSPRRRLRTADVAENLDMLVIGQVCLGVTITGYRKLLEALFSEQSGSFHGLLDALDRVELSEIRDFAHAFKGEVSVLGLHALAQQARHCEQEGTTFTPTDCQEAAQKLRECWQISHALCQRMGLVEQVPATP